MPRIIKKRLTPFHTGAPPAETDLRRTYRIPVSLSLQFSGRHRLGKTGTGLLADLSENGCRIHSTHPLKVGTSLALVAELPHPVLITEARVVRVAGQWSGLEFLRVSPAERTRLRHFLWSHISLAMINNQRPLFTLVCNSHPDRKGLKAIS